MIHDWRRRWRYCIKCTKYGLSSSNEMKSFNCHPIWQGQMTAIRVQSFQLHFGQSSTSHIVLVIHQEEDETDQRRICSPARASEKIIAVLLWIQLQFQNLLFWTYYLTCSKQLHKQICATLCSMQCCLLLKSSKVQKVLADQSKTFLPKCHWVWWQLQSDTRKKWMSGPKNEHPAIDGSKTEGKKNETIQGHN